MSQALATTQEMAAVALGTLQATSAVTLVQGAREMANALSDLIERQKLATLIQGRRHVNVEGWTTLGVMLGVVAREVQTTEQDGIYTAVVELVRVSDGACLSRASAECGDEAPWNKRPRYARRSMAQTRATAKACRLAFSWIMALAGYEPTPAEEMPETHPPRDEYEKRDNDKICSQSKEHRQLEVKLRELQLDRERVRDWCKKKWGVEHFSDLTMRQYRELLSRLTHFAEQMAKEMETAEVEAQAEREAIQAESQPEVSAEAKQRADELMERARSVRATAAHADRGQDYHRELQEADTLECEARALLVGK